jgi:hypothetical protein
MKYFKELKKNMVIYSDDPETFFVDYSEAKSVIHRLRNLNCCYDIDAELLPTDILTIELIQNGYVISKLKLYKE